MPERPRTVDRHRALVLAVLLAVAALIAAWLLLEVRVDPRQIRAWVRGAGPRAPILIASLEFLQVFISPLSGYPVEVASGFVYGPWLGAFYCMIGIVSGSLAGFALARRLGRPFAARLLGPAGVARLDNLAQRGGSLFFFLIWLMPFLPDDLACLAAGLTPMSPGRFLLLLVLGRLPGIWAANWVGANAVRLDPALWAVALAVAAIAAVAAWRWGGAARSAAARLLDRITGPGPSIP